MHQLKSIHIAAGIAGLVAFVLSGQYMAIFLNGLQDMADGPRLLYRSAHLYLMWASLLNLVIGLRFPPLRSGTVRIAQIVASFMLLAVPVLILIGFSIEARLPGVQRPYTNIANYLVLTGVLVHLITSREHSGATDLGTRK
jgi:hypothetical protein